MPKDVPGRRQQQKEAAVQRAHELARHGTIHWPMWLFLRYNGKEITMVNSYSMCDLKAKKDYFARVRRSNYVASMRLEGMPVTQSDTSVKPASRKAVLRAHNCQVAS